MRLQQYALGIVAARFGLRSLGALTGMAYERVPPEGARAAPAAALLALHGLASPGGATRATSLAVAHLASPHTAHTPLLPPREAATLIKQARAAVRKLGSTPQDARVLVAATLLSLAAEWRAGPVAISSLADSLAASASAAGVRTGSLGWEEGVGTCLTVASAACEAALRAFPSAALAGRISVPGDLTRSDAPLRLGDRGPALGSSLSHLAAAATAVASSLLHAVYDRPTQRGIDELLGSCGQGGGAEEGLALLERLMWLHGTAVAAARAAGRVDIAREACEEGTRGVRQLAGQLGFSSDVILHARTAVAARAGAGVTVQGHAPLFDILMRTAAFADALPLLLPLQHSLAWKDVDGAEWTPAVGSFFPPSRPLDLVRPFLPVARPTVPIAAVLTLLAQAGSAPLSVAPHPGLATATACGPEQWRSFLTFVESRSMEQLALTSAGRDGEGEATLVGLRIVGGPPLLLTRRRAAAMLGMYRDADASAVLSCQDIVAAALGGDAQGGLPAHLPYSKPAFREAGRHGSMMSHTLRLVSPLHVPASLPYLRDRVRLLLRMTAAAASVNRLAVQEAGLVLGKARPDVALLRSVLRECAAQATHPLHRSAYRLRNWAPTAGPTAEDGAAARLIVRAISASVPADTLALQLLQGMCAHVRAPTNSYATRLRGEEPPEWQRDVAEHAMQLGLPFGSLSSSVWSHDALASLSVPAAGCADYVVLRALDVLHGRMLLVHACTLLSSSGGDEDAEARIAALVQEREGALLDLLEGTVRARVLPSALADTVAEVTLRWGAILGPRE
jgi:hypothetical protein